MESNRLMVLYLFVIYKGFDKVCGINAIMIPPSDCNCPKVTVLANADDCYKGVTTVLANAHDCYKGVTKIFANTDECYKRVIIEVLANAHDCYKRVTKELANADDCYKVCEGQGNFLDVIHIKLRPFHSLFQYITSFRVAILVHYIFVIYNEFKVKKEDPEGIVKYPLDSYTQNNSENDINNEQNIENEGQEQLDDGRTNDDQSSTCDSDISLGEAPSLSSSGSGARTFQDYDSQDSTSTNDTRSYSDIELGDAPLLSLSSFYESSSDDS